MKLDKPKTNPNKPDDIVKLLYIGPILAFILSGIIAILSDENASYKVQQIINKTPKILANTPVKTVIPILLVLIGFGITINIMTKTIRKIVEHGVYKELSYKTIIIKFLTGLSFVLIGILLLKH